MALSVILSADSFNEFLTKFNDYSNELNTIKTGVNKDKVREWLTGLVNTIKSGINDKQTPVTPTSTQNVNDIDDCLLIGSQIRSDTQLSEEDRHRIDIPDSILAKIESRFQKLEEIMENISENRPSHHRKGNFRNNTKQYSQPKLKKCWTCGKPGHLSYMCYDNQKQNVNIPHRRLTVQRRPQNRYNYRQNGRDISRRGHYERPFLWGIPQTVGPPLQATQPSMQSMYPFLQFPTQQNMFQNQQRVRI